MSNEVANLVESFQEISMGEISGKYSDPMLHWTQQSLNQKFYKWNYTNWYRVWFLWLDNQKFSELKVFYDQIFSRKHPFLYRRILKTSRTVIISYDPWKTFVMKQSIKLNSEIGTFFKFPIIFTSTNESVELITCG